MPTGTTIVAISTAPGNAPRAMIRISGPEAQAFARDHLQIQPQKRGGYASRMRLGDAGSFPVSALFYPGPNSYSGEDTIEIILPGGSHLVGRVLAQLLQDERVRLAEPGEFSARAYMNGRLGLSEAEGIALRISALHSSALRAADQLLDGRYGQQCRAWVDEITTLLALVEAGVDFSDQDDVVPIASVDLRTRLEQLREQLIEQVGGASGDRVVRDAPSVVLIGRPNAGKSALFNALLGTTRAVVSDRAGTTRDALVEPLDLSQDVPGAGAVELVDLAGLGDRAIDAIDEQAQQRARGFIDEADAVLWCDPSGRFDERLFETRDGVPMVRVRTKSDLPAQSPIDSSGVSVCAFDASTLGVLRRAIADATSRASGSGVGVFVPRHRRALNMAIESIDRAMQSIDTRTRSLQHPELIALGLRESLDALGELVGEVSPDDVIGRVFATFCVGK
ncbi:MAG: hypothetical protein CMJ25_26840 [Phycisphaerae bacterium]|nr:hypothetical protein [Phycisphaerae bacterium]